MNRRRVFMTGGGKPVQPKRAGELCRSIVAACMDGELVEHRDDADFCDGCAERVKKTYFAIGVAACLDAISRGTLDPAADPVELVDQAYRDLNNVTREPNKVTDIMREFCK